MIIVSFRVIEDGAIKRMSNSRRLLPAIFSHILSENFEVKGMEMVEG